MRVSMSVIRLCNEFIYYSLKGLEIRMAGEKMANF